MHRLIFLCQTFKIVVFLVVFTTRFLCAQTLSPSTPIGEYELKSWTEIQETPIDRVFTIRQDKEGFLWIGSDRGLLKFDGGQVKVFDLKTDPIIETESIVFIEFDVNDRLWFATRRGLFYLEDNKAVQVFHKDGSKVKSIFSMFSDENGVVWFSKQRKIYSIENNQIKEHDYPIPALFRIMPGEDGQILTLHTYLNNQESIVYRWDPKTNKAIKINKQPIPVMAFTVKQYHDKLLIGGQWGELCEFNPINNRLHYWVRKNDTKTTIRNILVQKDGTIWAGGFGLHRVYNNKVSTLTEENDLSYNKVRSIFIDRDGNLWVGAMAGLNYISNTPFKQIPKSETNKNATFHRPLVINNQIVFGSLNQGMFTYDGENVVKMFSDQIIGDNILETSKALNGNLLLSTNLGGFEVSVDKRSLIVVRKIYDGKTKDLFQLSDGRFIINTSKGFYISKEDTLTSLRKPFLEIEGFNRTLGKDWISTNKGVYLIESDTLRLFDKHPSLSKYITSVAQGEDSTLWIGTYGSGLLHIKNENEVIHYDTRTNLPANQAMMVATSKAQGNWFFVTHKKEQYLREILPVNINGKQTLHLGKKFKWNFADDAFHEVGYDPKFVNYNGQLYLLTEDNLYLFQPRKVNYSQPKVLLKEVVVNGEKSDHFPTVIDADLEQLEFHLSTLDFTQEDRLSYDYMIEGYDKKWINMQTRSIAYYNDLPAGNYTFKARIRNSDNTFSYLTNPYSFQKLEFWYKTPWAKLIYILSILLIIIVVFQWRLKLLKLQRRKLQIKVDERTQELQYLNENLENLVEERTKKISLLNEDLTQSEERLKYALEATKDGIWDQNLKEKILMISEASAHLLGYELNDCDKATGIHPFIHPDDIEGWLNYYNTIQYQMDKDEIEDQEFRFHHKDGRLIWLLVRAKIVERDKNNQPQRIVGTYIDITEKKKKTQEVLEAIIRTEDNERQRISKDIHDGLQQTLTIASLNFQSVKKNLKEVSNSMLDKFETGWEYLQKSITESRSVAHSLMPKAIVDFGIISAFDSLITEVDKSSEEIQFSFFHNFEEHQIENHQIEITLYRILQEGINNIFKYSKATKVDIQLKNYEDIYMLTIEDNGVGFDTSKVLSENSGLGFKGMKNRLDAIGGFLEIESREGRGTTLLIEINKNF
ncbi:PAS domain S-box protein [Flammeovirga sp. MY04]|uniref:sensor histidine kinase n=1 Tax=Flammeovirga sp. MY04 TaxID=1191459 RepID=UPI0013053DC6|nr:two-component regulator propeller domain-containing protein [Flammeovirga sp. MY04]ANQ50289.2 PAS domain S-box protein [Flammeovirga sp. MY04]